MVRPSLQSVLEPPNATFEVPLVQHDILRLPNSKSHNYLKSGNNSQSVRTVVTLNLCKFVYNNTEQGLIRKKTGLGSDKFVCLSYCLTAYATAVGNDSVSTEAAAGTTVRKTQILDPSLFAYFVL